MAFLGGCATAPKMSYTDSDRDWVALLRTSSKKAERAMAMDMAGAKRLTDARQDLEKTVSEEKDQNLRRKAIWALHRIGPAPSLAVIGEAFAGPGKEASGFAIYPLALMFLNERTTKADRAAIEKYVYDYFQADAKLVESGTEASIIALSLLPSFENRQYVSGVLAPLEEKRAGNTDIAYRLSPPLMAALGSTRDGRYFKYLRSVAEKSSEKPELQAAALLGIAAIPTDEAFQYLMGLSAYKVSFWLKALVIVSAFMPTHNMESHSNQRPSYKKGASGGAGELPWKAIAAGERDVQLSARRALASIEPPRLHPPLLNILGDPKKKKYWAASLDLLGATGSPGTLAAILPFAASSDSDIRLAAIGAIAGLAETPAEDPRLLQCLTDKKLEAVLLAVNALTRENSEKSDRLLAKAYKYAAEKGGAIFAGGKTEDLAARIMLTAFDALNKRASPELKPILETMLRNGSATDRASAAFASIVTFNDRRAEEWRRGRDKWLRRGAALARIFSGSGRDAESVKDLMDSLDSEDIRGLAVAVAGKSDDAGIPGELSALLNKAMMKPDKFYSSFREDAAEAILEYLDRNPAQISKHFRTAISADPAAAAAFAAWQMEKAGTREEKDAALTHWITATQGSSYSPAFSRVPAVGTVIQRAQVLGALLEQDEFILDKFFDYKPRSPAGAQLPAGPVPAAPAPAAATGETQSLLAKLRSAAWKERRAAAFELGKIKALEAVEPLQELLEDENSAVCGTAAMALGRIGDKRALRPLIGLLEDASPSVRASAAKGLGYLKDKRAIINLKKALNDESPEVRKAVSGALKRLGGKGR